MNLFKLAFKSSTTFPTLLNNIKVLDLSRIIVGPYATMILSDYGAQVLKVQHPIGDQTRRWGPPWKGQDSTYFISINRNKKSICLDLKTQQGRKIIYQLSKNSDILVQNFIPGTTQKLLIDFQSIKKHNQKIVYCSISGYGDFGPKAHFPAFDPVIQGQAGFMHITGNSDTEPFKLGFAVADVITGLNVASAAIAGLNFVKNTGQGIHIKTSLIESSIAALINQASNYLNGNVDPKRIGNNHPNIVPFGAYKCKDRYISIACGNEEHFKSLCQILKIQLHKIFNSNKKRVENRNEVNQQLNKQLSKWESLEILQQMSKHKIPCGPINEFQGIFKDKQIKQLKMVTQVTNQNNEVYKMLRSPIRTNKNNIVQPKIPPKKGQHTYQILSQLGYNEDEINKLKEKKII